MTEHMNERTPARFFKFRGDVKAITGYIPLLAMWAASDFTPISEPVKHGNIIAIGLVLTVALFGAYVDARTSTHENERGLDLIEIRSQILANLGMSVVMFVLFKHVGVMNFIHQLNVKH